MSTLNNGHRNGLYLNQGSDHSAHTDTHSPRRSNGSERRNDRGTDTETGLVGLRDRFRIPGLSHHFALEFPENELAPHQLPLLPQGLTRSLSRGQPFVVAGRRDGQIVAYADFRPALPDYRWQLAGMGIDDAAPSIPETWRAVLTEGVRLAGEHGVKRIYARGEEGSAVTEALHAAGFAPYARETVFLASRPVLVNPGLSIVEQDHSDTWAIHQLYNASVPQEVQYSEAFTSHRWELPDTPRFRRPANQAWLIEEEGVPIAYCRVGSAGSRHLVDLLFHPGRVRDVVALVDQVLWQMNERGSVERIYCNVRTYQQEIIDPLKARGFEAIRHQDLFVRYTAVPVRTATLELEDAEFERLEQVKRRVPAYALSRVVIESRGETTSSGSRDGIAMPIKLRIWRESIGNDRD